jgi:hypothetical protein
MPATVTISKIEPFPSLGPSGDSRTIVTFNIRATGVQTDLKVAVVDHPTNPSQIVAEAQEILRQFASDL